MSCSTRPVLPALFHPTFLTPPCSTRPISSDFPTLPVLPVLSYPPYFIQLSHPPCSTRPVLPALIHPTSPPPCSTRPVLPALFHPTFPPALFYPSCPTRPISSDFPTPPCSTPFCPTRPVLNYASCPTRPVLPRPIPSDLSYVVPPRSVLSYPSLPPVLSYLSQSLCLPVSFLFSSLFALPPLRAVSGSLAALPTASIGNYYWALFWDPPFCALL